MSVRSRIRTRLLACCVIAVAALGALVFAQAAGAAKLGSTYLALGDSLAYGYHQAQFQAEYPNINPASFNDGYVDDFGAALKLANPKLQVINDGCPGETTETMIKGSGIPFFCAGGPTRPPPVARSSLTRKRSSKQTTTSARSRSTSVPTTRCRRVAPRKHARQPSSAPFTRKSRATSTSSSPNCARCRAHRSC